MNTKKGEELLRVAVLGQLAMASKNFSNAMTGWKVVRDLPLEQWRDKCDNFSDSEEEKKVLEKRKEIDEKKFSVPAKSYLMDINIALASLRLGQLSIKDFDL